MTKYRKFVLLLWISIAIAIVCLIVLNLIATDECANLPVVSYGDALKNINNYQFINKQSRIAMTSVGEYLVTDTDFNKLNLKVSELTDYAIYMIVSMNIASTNPNWIKVINDPRYIEVINGYDRVTNLFKSNELKVAAISVCKNYHDNPTDATIIDLYASLKDSEIYDRLFNPVSSISTNLPATTVSSPVDTTPIIDKQLPYTNTSGVVSTMTMEDGTVRTYYKDGESKSESPDGTTIITKADGSITTIKK